MKITTWFAYALLIIGAMAGARAVSNFSAGSSPPAVMFINTAQPVNLSLTCHTGIWTVVPTIPTKVHGIGSLVNYLNFSQAGVYNVMAKLTYMPCNYAVQQNRNGIAGNDTKISCTKN